MARSPKHVGRRRSGPRSATGHRATGRTPHPRTRHQGEATYSHLRVEIDLAHEVLAPNGLEFLGEIRAFLRDRNVEESESLLDLAAAMLHALKECGFSRVDHWEVEPGGWLPLPEAVHPGIEEPVGHLLKALASDRWQELATATAFSVRLSGTGDQRADAILRRRHREREHSLTLELRGHIPSYDAHRIVHTLRARLAVLRSQVTESTAA
ncbi:MAG TPA: hypothetical protein VLX64_04335 [Thermoplasmata archaeon]|nr:hypothetical protein [Thermoplasmata archaeon]